MSIWVPGSGCAPTKKSCPQDHPLSTQEPALFTLAVSSLAPVIHCYTFATAVPGACLYSTKNDMISAGLNSCSGILSAKSAASLATVASSSTVPPSVVMPQSEPCRSWRRAERRWPSW